MEDESETVRWKGEEHDLEDLGREQLDGLRSSYRRYRSCRRRDAIYDYLKAVYAFIRRFKRRADRKAVARFMAEEAGHVTRSDQDEFALAILATSEVDPRTRWKWARCLRRADETGVLFGQLQIFIAGGGRDQRLRKGEDHPSIRQKAAGELRGCRHRIAPSPPYATQPISPYGNATDAPNLVRAASMNLRTGKNNPESKESDFGKFPS